MLHLTSMDQIQGGGVVGLGAGGGGVIGYWQARGQGWVDGQTDPQTDRQTDSHTPLAVAGLIIFTDTLLSCSMLYYQSLCPVCHSVLPKSVKERPCSGRWSIIDVAMVMADTHVALDTWRMPVMLMFPSMQGKTCVSNNPRENSCHPRFRGYTEFLPNPWVICCHHGYMG